MKKTSFLRAQQMKTDVYLTFRDRILWTDWLKQEYLVPGSGGDWEASIKARAEVGPGEILHLPFQRLFFFYITASHTCGETASARWPFFFLEG